MLERTSPTGAASDSPAGDTPWATTAEGAARSKAEHASTYFARLSTMSPTTITTGMITASSTTS